MNIKNVKTAFHALTVAAATLASLGPALPAKYAFYVTVASSVISALLHIITRVYPDAAE